MKYIIENIKDYYLHFSYPAVFIDAINANKVDFGEWYLISEERAKQRLNGLRQRYPTRELIPFAKRDDCDDIACFNAVKKDQVEIIHDFASAGYEQRESYESFGKWLASIKRTC